jgi:4-hydroxythreonine-4-phosphate dehydrogenase
MSLPRIAVTMGDPAGVGPELCLRLLADERVRDFCTPIIFGDAGVLNRVANHLGWPEVTTIIPDDLWPEYADAIEAPCVLDQQAIAADAVRRGEVSAECGRAAYEYFTTAIGEALAGRVDASRRRRSTRNRCTRPAFRSPATPRSSRAARMPSDHA